MKACQEAVRFSWQAFSLLIRQTILQCADQFLYHDRLG